MPTEPTEPTLAEDASYIPLSERLNQDVFHDNFVPKYSALASVRPSRVVLIGVWLIFLPMICMQLLLLVTLLRDAKGLSSLLVAAITPVVIVVLSTWILVSQTRRYFRGRDVG